MSSSPPPESSPDASAPAASQTKARVRLALAWGGSVALMGWVLVTTDLGAAWRALLRADLLPFIFTAILFQSAHFLLSAATGRAVLARAGMSLPLVDYGRIFGASLLLEVVDFTLSLGAMVALLARRAKGRWMGASGVVGLLTVVDITAVALLATAAMALAGSPFGPAATLLTVGAAGAGLLLLPGLAFLARRPVGPEGLRAAVAEVLEAFRRPPRAQVLEMIGLRTLPRLLVAFELYIYARLFDFLVPWPTLLVFDGVLSIVNSVPISVADLGTTQVVMRELYAPYAPPGLPVVASIDALSTTTVAAVALVRVSIGGLCMRAMVRSSREAEAAARAAAARAESMDARPD